MLRTTPFSFSIFHLKFEIRLVADARMPPIAVPFPTHGEIQNFKFQIENEK